MSTGADRHAIERELTELRRGIDADRQELATSWKEARAALDIQQGIVASTFAKHADSRLDKYARSPTARAFAMRYQRYNWAASSLLALASFLVVTCVLVLGSGDLSNAASSLTNSVTSPSGIGLATAIITGVLGFIGFSATRVRFHIRRRFSQLAALENELHADLQRQQLALADAAEKLGWTEQEAERLVDQASASITRERESFTEVSDWVELYDAVESHAEGWERQPDARQSGDPRRGWRE